MGRTGMPKSKVGSDSRWTLHAAHALAFVDDSSLLEYEFNFFFLLFSLVFPSPGRMHDP